MEKVGENSNFEEIIENLDFRSRKGGKFWISRVSVANNHNNSRQHRLFINEMHEARLRMCQVPFNDAQKTGNHSVSVSS